MLREEPPLRRFEKRLLEELGYGLTLDSLNVQNISLPEELQAMLDKRIGVNALVPGAFPGQGFKGLPGLENKIALRRLGKPVDHADAVRILRRLSGRDLVLFNERLYSDEPRNLTELGADFGLSRERVRRAEQPEVFQPLPRRSRPVAAPDADAVVELEAALAPALQVGAAVLARRARDAGVYCDAAVPRRHGAILPLRRRGIPLGGGRRDQPVSAGATASV